MSEKLPQDSREAEVHLIRIMEEINRAKAEEAAIEQIRQSSENKMREIIELKGRRQGPDLRLKEYIRGITDPV